MEGIFWEKFFGRIFWRSFLGGFFGRIFGRNFFRRIFFWSGRIVFGGILFEEFFVFVKILSKRRKEGRRTNLDP